MWDKSCSISSLYHSIYSHIFSKSPPPSSPIRYDDIDSCVLRFFLHHQLCSSVLPPSSAPTSRDLLPRFVSSSKIKRRSLIPSSLLPSSRYQFDFISVQLDYSLDFPIFYFSEMMRVMYGERGGNLFATADRYCVDNGAMIAYTGLLAFAHERVTPFEETFLLVLEV
ncbi:hypothetical protein LXL04_002983 [Taraxacum kok-saghyz]